MSTVYIQEPPTTGKVLLVTSRGEIEVELWCKEAPKACRNFVQLCMEGYYNNTIFHRIVKNFIIQGGDPTGTGNGGESIYGAPFKDEVHQRLRFSHRGVLGMANSAPNDNGSQFFITLDRADELTGKHTVFGKVAGNTIFNVVAMGELPLGENERPEEPPRIIRTEVLNSFFDDILPRQISHARPEDKKVAPKNERKVAATKNFSLISFGDEAEEEEEAGASVKVGKMKSQFDVAMEEKKRKQEQDKAQQEQEKQRVGESEPGGAGTSRTDEKEDVQAPGKPLEVTEPKQKSRLDLEMEKDKKGTQQLTASQRESHRAEAMEEDARRRKKQQSDSEDSELNDDEFDARMRAKIEQKRGRREEPKRDDRTASKPKEVAPIDLRSREQKLEDLKREEELLKGELKRKNDDEDANEGGKKAKKQSEGAAFLSAQRGKYAAQSIPKKKESREELTLALLSKFKSKLEAHSTSTPPPPGPQDDREDDNDSGWLAHNLVDESVDYTKGINPELDPKKFDLHDPRNPLNIRKRGENTDKSSSSSSRDRRKRD